MRTSVTPFDGIHEKLRRADENICNLNAEVERFFQDCEYPILPKLDDEALLDAIAYHKALRIPPRFSVLAGEIIHHLRSCLDNVIWELSTSQYRRSENRDYIGFPILKRRPAPKNKVTAYKRKIKGVKSIWAIRYILFLQPYRSPVPDRDALWVLNYLDIADKHQGLVIVSSAGRAETTSNAVAREFASYLKGDGLPFTPEFKREFDKHGKVTPQIAFGDMAGGVVQLVIPTLSDLLNHIRSLIALFEAQLPK